MAPTIFGEHRSLICKDCGHPIRFYLEKSQSNLANVVCPNCGYADNRVVDAGIETAQPVNIRPSQSIHRWQVIAFQLPNSNAMGIKRVIGLPNEKIEIATGDLLVDGKLLAKHWNLQKAIRIPVYDSAYTPSETTLSNRWQPVSQCSAWKRTASKWVFDQLSRGTEPLSPVQLSLSGVNRVSRTPPNLRWDWLEYQNWRCCAHAGNRDDVHPVEDIDPFNPGLTRKLNRIKDLFFELNLEMSSDADFGWRCFAGQSILEFCFDAKAQQLTFSSSTKNDSTDVAGPNRSIKVDLKSLFADGTLNKSLKIEFSTFDGQLKLALNEKLILDEPLESRTEATGNRVFEVAGSQGKVQLHRIRIWRDVFYEPEKVNSFLVPADSYFLLGDNVAVSVDSRHWQPPFISANKILGTVEMTASH